MINELRIAYGSQGGNAKNLAHTIGEQFSYKGLLNEVIDMESLGPENLEHTKYLLIVVSTYGDGEAPDNASEWHSFLKFNDQMDLGHLRFAVLGLGDTYYPHFCQCAKDFDQYLEFHGAKRLATRLDCDLYYEDQYGEWLEGLTHSLIEDMKE